MKFLAPLWDLSGGGLAGMFIERSGVNLMPNVTYCSVWRFLPLWGLSGGGLVGMLIERQEV